MNSCNPKNKLSLTKSVTVLLQYLYEGIYYIILHNPTKIDL